MDSGKITQSRDKRGERDSNSRVRGTVDFKSTAIPGYAISACFEGGPFFQESIFPHSSLLAAIIARPRLAPTVAKVNPGKPESSSGLFAE